MYRIAIVGYMHETNTFALEENNETDAYLLQGEAILKGRHPRAYVGAYRAIRGFIVGSRRDDVELVPIATVQPSHVGIVHADVFEHYCDLIAEGLRRAMPLDGVYFALHGALAVEAPYTDGEASLLRAARDVLGDEIPFVGTYDFHGNYTDWEVQTLVAFPMNTNPHIDGYERALEAGQRMLQMLDGEIHPVTRRIYVPIIGPNIGQSTWSHDPAEEERLPMVKLNRLRAELEEVPGVINLTLQGGYGYADTPDTGMCVIATTDGDPALAEKLAKQLAAELWARREEIRTVRPIVSVDEGVEMAMARDEDKPIVLVDLGDDPGSATSADSPVVLESILRHGASDCVLTMRDPHVVRAAVEAGVGGTLHMEMGASIDQRFYKPLLLTGRVKLIDDGNYTITGPTHGGSGRVVGREDYIEANAGLRAVVRFDNKVDVIFSIGRPGVDRDFFKSAGISFQEKRILVVKSNQAHRASLTPVVSGIIDLATPGVSTPDYATLPYKLLSRPLFPIDEDFEWTP